MSKSDFSIVRVMEKTLNYADSRLINHGKRTAYLTHKILKKQNKHDENSRRKITLLALLHDVGAYKTEEIDQMLGFETQKVWEHSMYGYLFIKYFSPLTELAPAILFHHTDHRKLTYLQSHHRETAQIIKISDRFDISFLFSTKRDSQEIRSYFERRKGDEFCPDLFDLFFMGEEGNPLAEIDSDEEFQEVLYGNYLSEEDTAAFIKTLVLSIDFRSPVTALHTFSSTYACKAVLEILHVDAREQDLVLGGMLFHDIGKVAIPTNILNKSGRLTEAEMTIMKRHVEFAEEILADEVDDRVLKLAVRHHEKLDGSGYPRGLRSENLTKGERLMAVTDIFSALTGTRSYKDPFPMSKVVGILKEMVLAGQLDADIVSVFIDNYDWILGEVGREMIPFAEAYKQLMQEYDELERAVHFFDKKTTNDGCRKKNNPVHSWNEWKPFFGALLEQPAASTAGCD